jgi:DNA-directed RNA polymerase subunit RPC12/RpoP
MSNLVDESLSVICPICNKIMKQISPKHLKQHNLTTEQFKIKYFNYHIVHPIRLEQMKKARLKGKKKKEKQLVEKPCWNYAICKNKILVNINVGTIYIVCDECKSKGLIHPSLQKQKHIMSGRAKELNSKSEIIEKRSKTLRNRSKEEIESWKNKREKTLIEKDGENWKQIQHEKTKAGMLKTYGKEHALQVSEFLNQAQETHFLNTGYLNSMEIPENVEKVFSQRNQDEITKKTIQTNQIKYNGNSPMCSPEVIAKANRTRLKEFLPRLYIFLSKVELILLDEYVDAYTYNNYKCLKCGNIFQSNWNQVQQGRLCPSCNNKFKPSQGEKEVTEYLNSLGIKSIITNDRSLIKPYEIDILLPDYKICIEYCGLYTHREDVLKKTRKKINDTRFYHLYKLNECNKQGYTLLTIFEDEWLFKQEIVKSMLKQRLGCNDAPQIYARNCNIFEVTFEAKRDFLNTYHIQGNDNSQIMLGAFSEDDEMVALMTFSKPSISKGSGKQISGHWELNRFCTNTNYRVPGIAGKLLKYFQRNYNWNYIYSFADRRWSSGNLYNTLQFDLENDPSKIKPSYWYVDTNKLKRIHRFALRITDKDNNEGVSEQMYRVSQGYGLIYDCGNLKFSITR